MNVSVRANARVAEAARGGIGPALDVAFRGGAVTGMLVVGLALLGVAGYYGILTCALRRRDQGGRRRAHRPRLRRLADLRLRPSGRRHLHQGRRRRRRHRRQDRGRHPRGRPAQPGRDRRQRGRQRRRLRRHGRRPLRDLRGHRGRRDAARRPDLPGRHGAVVLFPLVLGGVSIIASIIGTFAVKSATGNVERALYQGLIVAGVIAALLFYPDHELDDGRPRPAARDAPCVGDLYLCALIGLAVTAALFVITDYYTSTRFAPGQVDGQGVGDRPRDEHHPGPRAGPAGHRRSPRSSSCSASAGANELAGDLRHRRRRHGAALADRPDRRARRVRPDHRQRRRHRRDGGHARGGPQRHRPARRGRQHDQGRHQGLRDRLRRARRARAVRGVQDRARRTKRRPGRSCSPSPIRTS